MFTQTTTIKRTTLGLVAVAVLASVGSVKSHATGFNNRFYPIWGHHHHKRFHHHDGRNRILPIWGHHHHKRFHHHDGRNRILPIGIHHRF